MSLKTKVTSLITTFILLCSLLTVGVFAVKNTTFNVGGDIVFNVQGIEATIALSDTGLTNIILPEGVTAGNQVFAPITIDNTTTAESIASQFAKWSNLDLTFAQGQSTASIELLITNTSSDDNNYIDITALADATTKDNARINVANDAGGITALLEPQQSATFTITFSVINDEYSASLEGFSVNFDMHKKVLADFPSFDADSRITITCDTTNKTASVTGENITQTNTEIEIPSYVQKDKVVCAVTSIGDSVFEYCFNLTSIFIPDTVTNLGMGTFADATQLTRINIPAGVTIIGEGTIYACSSLTSITIPDSVTSIGEFAFDGCRSLTTVNYTGTQEQWNAIIISEMGNSPIINATKVYNYTGV